MGTASTIKFIAVNKTKIPLINIYQQYDGYINCVGHDLEEWLMKKTLLNGFRINQTSDKYANGVGCLAAQYIKDHKEDIGELYIYPIDMSDEYVDYNHKVEIKDYLDNMPLDEITIITVTNFGNEKPIFVGKPSELLEFTEDGI